MDTIDYNTTLGLRLHFNVSEADVLTNLIPLLNRLERTDFDGETVLKFLADLNAPSELDIPAT